MLKVRVPDKLRELVEKFRINEEHYKSKDFLETQVRVEFINPLLRLLGWDVNNEAGHGPEYKDVIHELHSGDGRHIDYVFKVGSEKKFLIEAKRPSEDIAGNAAHALQAKAYAYRERIPLLIVTDFEEFSVYLGYRAYDREPVGDEGVEHRRVFFCRYSEYNRYWSFLFSLLSKKAIMLGLHDHLLKRLDEVKGKISDSIYTIGEFNLLYSIAQSFGGEEYAVEQDVEFARGTESTDWPDQHELLQVISAEPLQAAPIVASVANTTSFHLCPVYV
jgi:hypothetical protein